MQLVLGGLVVRLKSEETEALAILTHGSHKDACPARPSFPNCWVNIPALSCVLAPRLPFYAVACAQERPRLYEVGSCRVDLPTFQYRVHLQEATLNLYVDEFSALTRLPFPYISYWHSCYIRPTIGPKWDRQYLKALMFPSRRPLPAANSKRTTLQQHHQTHRQSARAAAHSHQPPSLPITRVRTPAVPVTGKITHLVPACCSLPALGLYFTPGHTRKSMLSRPI